MHRGWWKRDHIGVNLGCSKGIAFGSTSEQERGSKLPMFYKAAMSSSIIQQVQLPCARSNSLHDHKSSSGNMSSTMWKKGRSLKGSLLVCVYVHLQFHFTHQQLLQYNTLLPRVHMIEKMRHSEMVTDVSFCVLPPCLSVYYLLLTICLVGLFAKRFWLEKCAKQIEKLDTFCARCRSSWWLVCDQTIRFERKFFCNHCRSQRGTVARVVCILCNGGITDQRR